VNGLGRPLIILGFILVAAGLLASLAPRIPWLGKLPGDILIKREHFSFYFPLATSILISVGVSLILWLIRK
jgi:hypothetical protein